ncbi:L,D-transpeptidase [Corynebacterium caspium]|uniref:L,D-transpeptidase n=1 Tax=Corynebacterium caspium TaxID=234828 RepID=UPI000368B47A|nr:Ig-like domain-containing protein [Corynebacterium caspium]WKD58815.1 Putative L,D-transpeptidase LppS precursor [Corynebacterium caspium DSM 44850]
MASFKEGTKKFSKGLALLAVTASLMLSSCTIGETDTSAAAEASLKAAAAAEALAPAASVGNGDEAVNPTIPILVRSLGSGLQQVSMTNEAGYEVKAELSADKMRWTTSEVLGYGRTYTLNAVDNNGANLKLSFRTVAPDSQLSVALSPLPDSTVGIAQTIGFRFSKAVPDRKAAEARLKITTEPPVAGAFYWINPQEVRWRPAEFWAPGTKVDVQANIYGYSLGDSAYGSSDNATNFTIGDEVRTIVDDATKQMTVYRNGELLRSIPVSLGRNDPKWATPNGTYIVGDRYDKITMDSSTFGLAVDDGGYRTKVDWATQLSYSGIFVHSAPWSLAQQGNSNASHGCVNVSPEAAQWFFNTVKRGDPVEIRNTVGGVLAGSDGLGDWNIPWETWSAGNSQQ